MCKHTLPCTIAMFPHTHNCQTGYWMESLNTRCAIWWKQFAYGVQEVSVCPWVTEVGWRARPSYSVIVQISLPVQTAVQAAPSESCPRSCFGSAAGAEQTPASAAAIGAPSAGTEKSTPSDASHFKPCTTVLLAPVHTYIIWGVIDCWAAHFTLYYIHRITVCLHV